jgi:hypothetical protein
MSGGEVLELIDQEHFSLAFRGESSLRLAQEPFDRKEDELIEVGQAMLREMRAKLWIKLREPIDVTLVGILNFRGRLESQSSLREGTNPRRDGIHIGASRERDELRDDATYFMFLYELSWILGFVEPPSPIDYC